jgi:DNA-binding PucR family transcriptional regulator
MASNAHSQDVWLTLVAESDDDALEQFLVAELGPLRADAPEIQRLRETIQAWLSTGTNIATAEALGLHEHTVRNRLRRSEELLGRGLTQRRAELEAALHLWRPPPAVPPATTPDPHHQGRSGTT